MAAVDDAQAEALAAKAEHVASLARSTDVQTLYTHALQSQRAAQEKEDELYTSLVPTFVALHQQAASSQQLLASLELFLSTFQSDLSALSTHISALQTTSQQIDTRLDATREVEVELASFLAGIALSPRIVDLFLESEPEARPELWFKAVVQLEKVLDATTLTEPVERAQSQAVKQVQEVAQACRHLVTAKLRPYLTAPHAAIKASVTTNIQVLQTSVLLRHHRPLYGFLARQAPRVAIDVQRSYVAAARLYFETAFRRYMRSLGVARRRWTEPSTLTPITDARTVPTAPAASAQPSDAEAMSAQYADPWLFHPHRLQYSKLDGPTTVLGYMADDAQYKACPENLFRSASLVMLDNVCSEYTFLVRFFDGLEAHQQPDTKPAHDADSTVDETPAAEPEASVVQLTRTEQSRLQPRRGAVDLIFKQIFEPAILSWTSFVNSLLPASSSSSSSAASASAMPPFLSLLSMVRLNDSLLQLLESRGCSTPLVESALMGFKIHAYPLLKRQLDDQIAALVQQRGGPAPSSSTGAGMWNLLGGSGSATSAKTDATTLPLATTIATRYASLFTKTVAVLDDPIDDGLFANLVRMRQELEKLITTSPALRPHKIKLLQTILHAIENAASSLTHPKIQNEVSYWNEALRSASTS